MTPVIDNSLRKAADFVRGLPADAAAAMLGRLSAEEASALRDAIAGLDADNKKQNAPSVSDDGSVELQLSVAPDIPAPPAPTTPAAPQDGVEWLRSLSGADAHAIADYLSREQPRAIAAVLGYLPPDLGAGVLQCLPAGEQAKVVAQLAEQEDADPDSLRVITAGLADWVRRQQELQQRRTTRVATIRQILTATPLSQRRQLLDSLAVAEPEIAASLADLAPAPVVLKKTPTTNPGIAATRPAEPSKPTMAFDDLQRVDGRALAEAVGSLDGRSALLALAGAPEALLQKLTSGLPRTTAKDLRARIHRVGPTTLAEIDRSQAALTIAVEKIIARRRADRGVQLARA